MRGRVGISVGLGRGGRESSLNSSGSFDLGSNGFCCGSNGLGLGEAQGLLKELQVGLGRVLRPINLNGLKGCNEGVTGVGFGPEGDESKGGGVLFREEPPIPLSGAQSEILISKVRGVSRDGDPLVGITRVAMPLEALEVVERVSMTNEALCEEASRYVKTLSFSVGGWELSSSTLSSGFDWVVLKGGFRWIGLRE